MTGLERKLAREISIFLVGLGGLLLLLSVLFLGGAPAAATTPGKTLGWVVLTLGGIHVSSGILLALTRHPRWGVTGAVANALLSLTYFVWVGLWLAASGQQFKPNLLMGLAILMPIFLGQQVAKLVQARKALVPGETVQSL
jgi:hypothetical protein